MDKQRLNERAALIFPYALGAAVPLAGLFLAIAWLAEKRNYDAGILLLATLLGTAIWAVILLG